VFGLSGDNVPSEDSNIDSESKATEGICGEVTLMISPAA
jgi:hypothetical protein